MTAVRVIFLLARWNIYMRDIWSWLENISFKKVKNKLLKHYIFSKVNFKMFWWGCIANKFLPVDPKVENSQADQRNQTRNCKPCPINVVINVIVIESQFGRSDLKLSLSNIGGWVRSSSFTDFPFKKFWQIEDNANYNNRYGILESDTPIWSSWKSRKMVVVLFFLFLSHNLLILSVDWQTVELSTWEKSFQRIC